MEYFAIFFVEVVRSLLVDETKAAFRRSVWPKVRDYIDNLLRGNR